MKFGENIVEILSNDIPIFLKKVHCKSIETGGFDVRKEKTAFLFLLGKWSP